MEGVKNKTIWSEDDDGKVNPVWTTVSILLSSRPQQKNSKSYLSQGTSSSGSRSSRKVWKNSEEDISLPTKPFDEKKPSHESLPGYTVILIGLSVPASHFYVRYSSRDSNSCWESASVCGLTSSSSVCLPGFLTSSSHVELVMNHSFETRETKDHPITGSLEVYSPLVLNKWFAPPMTTLI